jgi:endonuclease/exonuclease/phosphatase family metal-dependent hydrolase
VRRRKTSLKVISLNLAHGRKKGRYQALQKRRAIQSNLDDVANVLRRERPDVVALQEADGPSLWSGNFDHVAYLTAAAELPYFFRGEHVKGMKLSYGTALLSQAPLKESLSFAFPPSPPTFTKGFVLGTISWPGRPGFQVEIASIHLDFSRAAVRRQQVQQIVAQFSGRDKPRILMGDFNCRWAGRDRSLRVLAEELDLIAYKPTAKGMNTFSKLRRRLDWILISPELEFANYENLPDTLSDHRAVVAVLRTASEGD